MKLASASRARPPHQFLSRFIDEHRESFGVESVCKVLHIAPSGYWRDAAAQRNPALRTEGSNRDDTLVLRQLQSESLDRNRFEA